MSASEKSGPAPSGIHAPPQDWVAQIRQISVPVWARALALILSLAVLLPGIVLIWGGWLGCAEFMKDWLGDGIVCHEKWIAQGIEIVVAALVPVVAILYLVFAETGMRSLARRTDELLEKIVPQALRSEGDVASTYSDGIESCAVAASHPAGSISAHYRLQYRSEDKEGALRLTVSVNVDKAVIVFFLPKRAEADPQNIRELMTPTMRGAIHEGYVFDEEPVETTRDGQRYLLLIARRSLPADFLWNPAAKLHFAWDLRAFAYSVIHDGHSLLRS
ncbi:MAG: hypothetical protein N3C63_02160 [Rhodocyclaceae bacterium]|nr:hypothetical protein [Rhodocyclaceae bacterium]